jgi:hypothetical protein
LKTLSTQYFGWFFQGILVGGSEVKVYEAPVVEEMGKLEEMIQLTGALNAIDGEMFNS